MDSSVRSLVACTENNGPFTLGAVHVGVRVPHPLTHTCLCAMRTKGNGGVKALPVNLNENGTAKGTVVTVVKWNLYQSKKNAKRNEVGTKNEFLPITEKEDKNIYLELRFLNTEKVK